MYDREELIFVTPTAQHLREVRAYRQEFLDAGDDMDGTGPLRRCPDPEEWLRRVLSYTDPATVPPNLVQATQFLCIRKNDGRVLGMVQVRHTLNDYLREYAGHIGYSVRPSERRKGYAKWMLRQALDFCRSIGLTEVMISCEPENEGSRRMILSGGGVYESTVFEPHHSIYLERYWIDLSVPDRKSFHFRPAKGWINDPNGLVWFKGYYHIFYQHSPNFETPWHESMHWGHARTKDFVHFEELPVALFPDMPYDKDGCWSGTAIVKDDVLYLFYAGVCEGRQTACAAFSEDGLHFEKYHNNPVIAAYPPEGSPDFRDPAVTFADGKYRLVMASGNKEKQTANLLLYESDDLLHWTYTGVMSEWPEAKFAECPSFLQFGDRYLLAASVCREHGHSFSISVGTFRNGVFIPEISGEVDKGPDQYAGQIFRDHLGRAILLSWMPGWDYAGIRDRDIGCLSLPKEITVQNGKLRAFPIAEVRHFLKEDDPAIHRTEDGFRIHRTGRDDVVFKGELRSLSCARDGDFLEIFLNEGEEVYTALL